MAERHHRVARYAYNVNASTGFGRVSLWNAAGESIGEIGFVDENRIPPNCKLAVDLTHGVGFMPANCMLTLIDMLRNESTVFLSLCDDPPGFVSLHAHHSERTA